MQCWAQAYTQDGLISHRPSNVYSGEPAWDVIQDTDMAPVGSVKGDLASTLTDGIPHSGFVCLPQLL